ncbi:MAG: hypothetical protein HY905_20675 [Deltaproteobacteria bacterium]|nr:hypothetical protein [Deltaproteobacteria bacterium]
MGRIPLLALGTLLASCSGGDTPYDGPPVGLLDDSPLLPFPSIHLMAEDPSSATGWRVAIPEGLLPVSDEGTPLDLVRFNHRDGFSTAQPLVLVLPDADIDPASLPGETDVAGSLEAGASVKLIDVETGERVPLFAELDLAPEAVSPATRAMIIRPMRALEFATHYAVVLTTDVRLRGGGNLQPLPRFAALRDGRSPHKGLDAWLPHYDELLDALERHGVPRASMALAWDFWTASDESIHRGFQTVLAATREDIPDDPDFEPVFTAEIEDAVTNPDINPHVLRRVRGSFSIVNFIGPDRMFEYDADGLPVAQSERLDVKFLVVVPKSAETAEAGTFSVLIYGHGLMDSPEWPLGDDRDGDSVQRLADEMHWIVIGTEWRGLSNEPSHDWSLDEVDAAEAAVDFGKFPLVTDRLQQGVANALALPRLMRSQFRNADFLQAPGGGSLVDPDRMLYYGISLGGIEGATFVANSELVDVGIFHVPGGAWTTMLERSSNWDDYDTVARMWTPSAVDRQVLYAATQDLWDPVDPITHITRLRDKTVLWQESIGDAQVSNLATEMMARSVGVPLLQPSVTHPCCIDEAAAPLPAGSSALMQYDPGCGRPDPGNRPAVDNHAHSAVRNLDETLDQIRAFFEPGAEGTIIHPCTGPCVWTTCP